MNALMIDGNTMNYLDQGEGEVLVFGHSYLWDSEMWAPQVAALSQHYRCIVPDFWAHGQSDAAPAPMRSLQDYARHVLALMDHLSIERFSIIGLSVGGMWGAELALLAPQRVQSLVLMDTFLGLEPQVTHQKYFAMLETIEQLKMIPPAIVEAVVPLFFSSQVMTKAPHLAQQFATHLSELTGDKAVEIARVGKMVFGRRDVMEEAGKLVLPVLIAVGAEDKPRPALESYLMTDEISGSQLVLIPDAGHISNLEQPEFVTEMLQTFLQGVYAN